MSDGARQERPSGGQAWQIVGASARGSIHLRLDLPNQDAFGHRSQEGATVLAVADGHGARLHHRSEIGAAHAVQTALKCLKDGRLCLDVLPQAMTADWRRAVLAHARAQESDDWILAEEDAVIAYGTTLLCVRIREDVVALQIGDGDILFGSAKQGIWRPLPDDTGMPGEATYSLCTADAPKRFRSIRLERDAVDFVMLSTDGLGKSFASQADLFKVGGAYREQALGGQLENVGAGLQAWLDEVSRRGSGDDATLLMAGRPAPPFAAEPVERTTG